MTVSDWRIEVYSKALSRWHTVMQCPREYGEGYLDHHRDAPGPRLAMRLVDPAGRVRHEVKAEDTVTIGLHIAWPTAGQYEVAAADATERARLIREREQLELEHKRQICRERWS